MASYFVDVDNRTLNFTWKCKTVKISIEGLTLPISRQYKTMVVERASMWSVESSSSTVLKDICPREGKQYPMCLIGCNQVRHQGDP